MPGALPWLREKLSEIKRLIEAGKITWREKEQIYSRDEDPDRPFWYTLRAGYVGFGSKWIGLAESSIAASAARTNDDLSGANDYYLFLGDSFGDIKFALDQIIHGMPLPLTVRVIGGMKIDKFVKDHAAMDKVMEYNRELNAILKELFLMEDYLSEADLKLREKEADDARFIDSFLKS